jgi:uncharacterized protein
MGFQSVEPEAPPAYLITAEEYGDFLVELFDEWYESGFPSVSVRAFDALLQSFLGMPNDLCVYSEGCNAGIVVEYNGDVYPCDFYISESWRLGNVMEERLESIVAKPALSSFAARKRSLPARCEGCGWRNLCRGGCPRNRPGDANGTPEYFCESHRRLFAHADERFRAIIARMERWLTTARAVGPPTGRNERCPCGSGRKYKACCGDPRIDQSYLFRS